MALLNEQIPVQQFEVIRDRIGEILKDEIDNQFALFNNPDLKTDVYVERFVPFSHTDLSVINVRFVSGIYDIVTVKQSDGTYDFFIDVYANGKTTATEDADPKALKKLQRLVGVVRAILENPVYTTLGWAPPSIESTSIKSIDVADPKNNQDTASNVFSRLVFTVRVPETTQLKTAPVIAGFETKVKLGLTDKGYLWEGVDV